MTTAASSAKPWFARAPSRPHGHAAIIGAGIAGASLAQALTRRGWKVTIIDRHGQMAGEASGTPVAVIMPRLTAGDGLEGRFHAAAWRFAVEAFDALEAAGFDIGRNRCGVLQLAETTDDAERLQAIAARGVLSASLLRAVSAAEAAALAGIDVNRPGLFFPQGGFLNPAALCAGLTRGVDVLYGVAVTDVRRTDGQLQVLDAQERVCVETDVVVLANALGATRMPATSFLPLTARRGQLTFASPTTTSASLRSVVVSESSITPPVMINGARRHVLGATFDWITTPQDAQSVAATDHSRNRDALDTMLPGFLDGSGVNADQGWAGVRCMSPDHLPVAGPVPDDAAYRDDYADLHHGRHWLRYPNARYQPGLYVLSGLGARGVVTAPLAAEILACHVTGEAWPVDSDLVDALHPGRFLVRDLKKKM